MDSLRGAALALKKSPRVVRKKLDRITGRKEGRKLFHSQDEDVSFCVKQLGSIDLRGECTLSTTEAAVRNLLSEAKKSRIESKKKLPKMNLTVATEKLCVEDAATKELMYEVDLQRISKWQVDALYTQVFSFVEDKIDSPVCHAFISPKPSVTVAITEALITNQKFLEDAKKEGIDKKRNDIDSDLQKEAGELYSDLGQDHGISVEQTTADIDSLTFAENSNADAGIEYKGTNDFNDFSSSDEEAPENSMNFIYSNLKSEESGEKVAFDAEGHEQSFQSASSTNPAAKIENFQMSSHEDSRQIPVPTENLINFED